MTDRSRNRLGIESVFRNNCGDSRLDRMINGDNSRTHGHITGIIFRWEISRINRFESCPGFIFYFHIQSLIGSGRECEVLLLKLCGIENQFGNGKIFLFVARQNYRKKQRHFPRHEAIKFDLPVGPRFCFCPLLIGNSHRSDRTEFFVDRFT